MKLMQTMIAGHRFRDPGHNPARLAMLDVLLAVARLKGVDLLMLPAGYLAAESLTDRGVLIVDVAQRAEVAGVVVAFGVDLPDSWEGKGARSPRLPFYAAVRGSVNGGPWQQTSSTSVNAEDVADTDVPGADRIVILDGYRVGVLICGELFSWWARESFARMNLNLALDLGHYGMGTGVTAAMENIARNGNCAVAHTHHVAGWNDQSLHFVEPGGERVSISISDREWVGDTNFWATWCLREI
jgi:hypothetical protein